MRKLATLSSLLLLSACGEEMGNSIFSGQPPTTSSSDLCQKVSYTSQSSNTSGADPLLGSQWHLLNNTGTPGSIKEDINLQRDLWNTVTGSGISIAVIDNSIDYSHPDLQANLDLEKSCQLGSSVLGGHATSVAGLIAAVKGNALGGSGVAPGGKIQGFNILALPEEEQGLAKWWTRALSTTVSGNTELDIFNLSLGYGIQPSPISFDTTIEALTKAGTESGREGLGALYFKAAGNNFESSSYCQEENYHSSSLPCYSSSLDPDNNIPYMMVVGALNAEGRKAYYSSSGSNILFSAPGGGKSGGTVTTRDIYIETSTPPSEMQGYSGYTDSFTGTSAATPVTSGVAALILEANSNLGWRDVRDILIRSADQVDPSLAPITLTTSPSFIVEPAWLTNAAGLKYHNYYGFGRINAVNAVNRAKNYGSNLPAMIIESVESSAEGNISDDISTPLSLSLTAPSAVTTVESVQLRLEISHTYPSDLMVKLISPSGTESILLAPRSALSAEVKNFRFTLLSQTFYGEDAAGSWTLQIYDTDSDIRGSGTLHNWSMTLYGH